ncbi:glutaminase [Enterovibrio norvegicus FF-162]|uniref:Glutaminase n=1 Tax=Enterovibrio norvegicus FF-454 TaxID=1185651 RepID=A0A1E5C2H2_9GAMM|nr:glutaminase A [Enterovibrio norvegicus]OEE59704.1 glutaminase [Enterovibrio norvegicus FF-454]OEE87448.1 glutaminase [Enterovibrio norvegicus FF-162]
MSALPSPEALQTLVDETYAQFRALPGGENASYIPYLASVPSDLAALVIVTADGDIYQAGDSSYGFAIESISKVPTLALLMEDVGPEMVREKIGAEPTGLPFNSVVALCEHQDKPLSPLVNAGAMASVSLLTASDPETRWARILDMQQRITAGNIVLSDDINASEQTTNFHNRGIAWILYAAGNCFCDPMEAVDVYTRQCSTLVTCKDLAVLSATLSNRGKNPISGEQVISAGNVAPILAEMTMEGLYDYSGDWAFEVGMPGKSGVGGGVLAVAPGKLGIAAFSPPLDESGNSVRAQRMISHVAKTLNLNLYAS